MATQNQIDWAIAELNTCIVRSFDGPVLVIELDPKQARRILRRLLKKQEPKS